MKNLIEDPYGFKTDEVSEQQANPDELALDSLDSLDKLDSESLEDQLSKLAKVLESVDQETGFETDREDGADTERECDAEEDAEAIADCDAEEGRDCDAKEKIAEDEIQEVAPYDPLNSIPLTAEQIQPAIEALLFISDKPLSPEKLREILEPGYPLSHFSEAVAQIRRNYQASQHGIELVEVAGGYQFRSKASYAAFAKKLVRVLNQRLSSGAMETLSIIAYKQPAMKEDVDKIRGVDSSYFVRNLIDKKLIKISGRSELPGRPMLYSTTPEFLEIFGLPNLGSLPSLRELEEMIPGTETGNPEDADPHVREMRRLVAEMKADRTSALHYDPREDEKILKEIREKVVAIPTSTPYLDGLKAAEKAALNPEVAPIQDGALVETLVIEEDISQKPC